MKRILLLFCLILNTLQLSAQSDQYSDNEYVKLQLNDFDIVDIDAPVKIELIKLENNTQPYIEYNTHGYYASRFTVDVDKNKRIVTITERLDSKRERVTDVRLYYNSLHTLRIAQADVGIRGKLTGQKLDIIVASESHLIADIDVMDLLVNISGRCRVVITGNTKYQSAEITTAQYDALGLESESTIVNVSHNGMAKVDASDRLQAITSTGGQVFYAEEPAILRTESSLFGGSISKI